MGREGFQVLIRGQGTSEELLAIGQQILRDLDPSPPSEPDRSGAGPTSRMATTHSDHKRSPHHRAPPTQCTRKNALSALNAEKIPSAP